MVYFIKIAKKILYIANVGDTRSVLQNGAKFLRISYDHKSSDSKEQLRV
tara:strand:- start:326 stop:472 length:147 start_codon:yes stop_codon:yes gene_type:complete